MPYIEQELKNKAMPSDLKYIAIIESNLMPTTSPAGAKDVYKRQIYNNVIENIFLASLLMIIGIILGFLIFNWPKAKIYMGDSGSMLLGYISAIWGIKYIWNLGNLIPNISYHWVEMCIRDSINGDLFEF